MESKRVFSWLNFKINIEIVSLGGLKGDKNCLSTPLEHTPKHPKPLPTGYNSFHSWLGGLPGVCSRGVL